MEKRYPRKCPDCGETVFHSSVASRSHCRNNKCRKCSDYNKDRATYGKLNGKWNGYKDIPLSYFNEVKRNAQKRNISFNITIENAWDTFNKQDKKCIYTGITLSLPQRTRSKRIGEASLDRIDSSKGYTTNNIQWVHKDINWMKQDFTNDYFVKMCRLVSENK